MVLSYQYLVFRLSNGLEKSESSFFPAKDFLASNANTSFVIRVCSKKKTKIVKQKATIAMEMEGANVENVNVLKVTLESFVLVNAINVL